MKTKSRPILLLLFLLNCFTQSAQAQINCKIRISSPPGWDFSDHTAYDSGFIEKGWTFSQDNDSSAAMEFEKWREFITPVAVGITYVDTQGATFKIIENNNIKYKKRLRARSFAMDWLYVDQLPHWCGTENADNLAISEAEYKMNLQLIALSKTLPTCQQMQETQ